MVEWVDAHSSTQPGWATHENIVEQSGQLLTCLSVGWLVHDGRDCKVVLPNSYAEDGEPRHKGCSEISIPTRVVVSMTELRPVRQRVPKSSKQVGTRSRGTVRKALRRK